MPRSFAAIRGGKVGYPPNPMTTDGRTSPSTLIAATMPRDKVHTVCAMATGDLLASVAEGIRWILRAGKPVP